MVKKVFYIEKEPFLRSMLEFALKAKGAEIFTIDRLRDNEYLLDDLSPDLIIFDVETCKDDLSNLVAKKKNARLVATGKKEDEQSVSNLIVHFIPKPIEAQNIAIKILSLLD